MHLFFEAKNGEPTVRYRDTLLHSSYNPGREARRFADRAPRARCYLILGGGLGHLAAALNRGVPDAHLLTVHPSGELAEAAAGAPGGHVSPASRRELAGAMATAFGAESRYGFELLLWEPASKAAPEWIRRQQEWALSIAREWHGSLLSTGYFGPTWLRNAVRNLIGTHADALSSLPLHKQPVLAVPGPTLDRDLPWLRREREGIFLLAVSSALAPLAQGGLTADLLVHTDGGFWATHHLRPQLHHNHRSRHLEIDLRGVGTPLPPVAAPIRAAFPAGLEGSLSLLLVDPTSPIELALRRATRLPALPLPGHGTVSGTALRLLRHLSDKSPLLLGLDLAVEGLRSHCKGHAFEPLLLGMSRRERPLPTVLRNRLGEARRIEPPWRQPRDLQLYAESLAAELAACPNRCRRLHPSPVALPCEEVSEEWSLPTVEGSSADRIHSSLIPTPREPSEIRAILQEWHDQVEAAQPESLLSPDREPESLIEELAQFLALPELLRLRKSSMEGGGVEEAIERLKSRLRDRIESLMLRSER